MKRIIAIAALITCGAVFTACSGTFNAAEASELTIEANGVCVQVASANGDAGYDALTDALSGAVYKGSLDDCSFGDVKLTFVIEDEEVCLYPCNDEDCGRIAKGDYSADKCEYLKISDDDRKDIFEFINNYAS